MLSTFLELSRVLTKCSQLTKVQKRIYLKRISLYPKCKMRNQPDRANSVQRIPTNRIWKGFIRTILLLLGGTVDPVVLVRRPDHLKLVEEDLELPGVGHEGVNIRGAVARPVLDQI